MAESCARSADITAPEQESTVGIGVLEALYCPPYEPNKCRPRDPSWMRLRPDVPAEWESLAVYHYSVFYYLSRAAQRRNELFGGRVGEPTHPEDVIYLLRTCCENVKYFYDALRTVAESAVGYLPNHIPTDFPFREINVYRNLFLHNPVLGRGELHGETLLPRLPANLNHAESWVSMFKFSWRAVERLDTEDLVAARSLLLEFEDGLAKYLNDTWTRLISDLRGRNLHDKFQFLKLPSSAISVRFSNRITSDSGCATLAQPIAASATFSALDVSRLRKGSKVR